MLSWSTSVTDIYLDIAWYKVVHTSHLVKYTVGHKNGADFIIINSNLTLTPVQRTKYSYLQIPKQFQFKLQSFVVICTIKNNCNIF